MRNGSIVSHNMRSIEDVVAANIIRLESGSEDSSNIENLDEDSANVDIHDLEHDLNIPDENSMQIRCPLCNNMVNVDS